MVTGLLGLLESLGEAMLVLAERLANGVPEWAHRTAG